MKKIIALICFFLCTNLFSLDEIEFDYFESQEEVQEEEIATGPISINISINNTNEVCSNNKTIVYQEKEAEKKRGRDYSRLLSLVNCAALVALQIAITPNPSIMTFKAWKLLW